LTKAFLNVKMLPAKFRQEVKMAEHALSKEEIERIQEVFRIPVESAWPGTYWIVSLDWDSTMPTDEELGMIASYCAFSVQNLYKRHYAEEIMAQDFPKEAGYNTVIFRKGSYKEGTEKHWFYRRTLWEESSTYWPDPRGKNYKGLLLIAIMDHIQSLIQKPWIDWKDGRPMIFGAQAGGE